LIILGAWTLWKHRNRCVFDAMMPNLAIGLAQANEDRKMWELAGAKGVSFFYGVALRTGSCLSNRNWHECNLSDVTVCVLLGVL
jgi:hypothetical protein